MKRLAIITVGKTHSGKTTFAKALEKELPNSVVIDQDNHAEFLQSYYKGLLPKRGPNTIKYSITKTIVDYAAAETDCHLILCNSNRNQKDRQKMLKYYHSRGFTSILVSFNIPDDVLRRRIMASQRSTSVLRVASSFLEVLSRQQAESNQGDIKAPAEGEADYLLNIGHPDDVAEVIRIIADISMRLD
ncbi:ATP-binding protein [Cytobacillus firmus]|uniref:AAA family ATPase n=1 Tax=Cytobacillus firmus TaxID=1399 RepID=UPI00216236EB|nr:ATP-binding protein [Cytobacillus firmus]